MRSKKKIKSLSLVRHERIRTKISTRIKNILQEYGQEYERQEGKK